MTYLFFTSSSIVSVTCIISLILSFVTLSSHGFPMTLQQKSISVAFNICFVVSLFGHISQLYVIIILIMVLYIILLLMLFLFLSQSIPFATVMAFFSSRFQSSLVVSNVPSFVISTSKYLYFVQHLISCPFSSVKFCCFPLTHMYSVLLMLISSPHFWYSSISLCVIQFISSLYPVLFYNPISFLV